MPPPETTVSKPKRRVGRPTKYTPELAKRICREISTTHHSLRKILEAPGMPTVTTVMNWRNTLPEFLEQYARAKKDQAELLASQTVEIADNATPEDVQVARLRNDARKWLAGKLAPKEYGERRSYDEDAQPDSPVEVDKAAKLREFLKQLDESVDGELA